jgi:hypothetical protein
MVVPDTFGVAYQYENFTGVDLSGRLNGKRVTGHTRQGVAGMTVTRQVVTGTTEDRMTVIGITTTGPSTTEAGVDGTEGFNVGEVSSDMTDENHRH